MSPQSSIESQKLASGIQVLPLAQQRWLMGQPQSAGAREHYFRNFDLGIQIIYELTFEIRK